MVLTHTKQRPTFKTIANRQRALLNWKKQYSGEIIEILLKRREIILDDSTKVTAYYLPPEEK